MCFAGAIVIPEIGGSSVPRLRTKRGCEPPATSTRSREPAGNRCATASSSSRTVPESVVSLTNPSLTLVDLPSASTSLSRTNTSLYGLSHEWDSSTTGVPTT